MTTYDTNREPTMTEWPPPPGEWARHGRCRVPDDGDSEVVAWKCKACGYWVSEWFPDTTPDPCVVDWRRPAEDPMT